MRVLAVQTYGGANPHIARHYPYYEKCGADRIIGITTLGGGCEWPGEDVAIGKDCYAVGDHLSRRLIDTIDHCIMEGADEIIVSEWDNLFFRAIPPLPRGVLVMNPTGGAEPPLWRGKRYYHPPWCMDRATALVTVYTGRVMLADGDIEHGWPDRFIGRLAERAGIPVVSGLFTNYSRNALDQPEYIAAARQAIADGAHCVHGVKNAEILEGILK